MIADFIDFCTDLFPCINPYTKEKAKAAMEQFENISGHLLYEAYGSLDLYQGDIFSEIPFIFVDQDGNFQTIFRKAQLLSNTCDASRDEHLIFAAIHPLDELSNPSLCYAIKKNEKYSAFFIPDVALSKEFIDMEMITTYSRETFMDMCRAGKVHRIASLTLVGFYMLICKLTVFLMRPEDREVNSSRLVGNNDLN